MKKFIKKIIYKEKYNSASYIAWMRSKGARVGEHSVVFSPRHTTIDMTRPWLIDIGDDVQITEGVTILTHGYDWSVLKGLYGEVLGSAGGGTYREQCVHRYENYHIKRCTYRKQCNYWCEQFSK